VHSVIDNSVTKFLVDLLRNASTKPSAFQRITNELSYILAYEVSKNAATKKKLIETWQGTYEATSLPQDDVAIIPILRAGLGMLGGVQKLLPGAQVHVLGMYRDEETLNPVWYYNKIPQENTIRKAYVIDPMLATGGSMVSTISALKEKGCKDIVALSIIGAPEGLKAVEEAHPDVHVYLSSLDDRLNEKGYIIPGLGDAGDRIFNT
jgi:uracil phosphoribosyltransferase